MSQREEDATLEELESGELDPLNREGFNGPPPPSVKPTRSMYAMTRSEITRGIANRFVHSRMYIAIYLVMAALSITTVVLSLKDGCPGAPFFILEIIINTAMILEVVVRFLAFGSVRLYYSIYRYAVSFWKYPFNVFDLIVTFFSVITLLVIFFAGCGTATKEEEILDTLLLVARNTLQFGRLASVVRQSGHSIFSRPKPIDLNAARRAGFSALDLPSDDEDEPRRPGVLFDVNALRAERTRSWESEMPRAAQAVRDRDDEDVWASLG
ncbi:hypothetical protein K488DRAFT_46081 [Vararia minispora EC-137]|uniref:Uncharacterized protein n=1 Tax=Vararia minispora EC-137 TaxID=1314806 RepID=A0ACB8QRI7_9AGAM|nr:hypothetical protein K488DRAFT_46081 [Vararia minispora EC-137]